MAAIKKIKLPRVTTPYDILDANAVHKTGDEEINGKKTFNNSPLVPTPTVDRGATPKSYVDSLIAGVADAMLFKGTLGQAKDGATVTALPANHKVGWTYKVVTAATYAGMACEVGDMIACIKTRTTANNADWTVFQGNIDGAVTGPTSSTDAHVATFNGATGKVIKDSGFTIGKSVPADAKFTDTQLTDGQIAAMGYTKNAVPIAGGTMTGNLNVGYASIRTNGYVVGTWFQGTAANHLANAATKFDTWAERNENIDILLIHFATDMDDKVIEELGHDKLIKSGLIDIVKETVINFYEIDAAIAFAESPMRLLTKIAKEMPEFSKRVDEVMKNAPSKK